MPANRLGAVAPAGHAKAEPSQYVGGIRAERAKTHDADRNGAGRPLKLRLPAFFALAGAQVGFLPVVHQHMQHDIFRHPMGEVADRDANQRHFRQRRIRHQRVDARAQVENDAQVRECRELARGRLPDRGVMDIGGIATSLRQQPDRAVAAHLVKPALPARRRPVIGPAVNEQGERTFVHRDFAFSREIRATLLARASATKYFRFAVGPGHTCSS